MILPGRRFHLLTMLLLPSAIIASLSPLALTAWWMLAQLLLSFVIGDGLLLLVFTAAHSVHTQHHERPSATHRSPLQLWWRKRPSGIGNTTTQPAKW